MATESESPRISFDENDKRPYVQAFTQQPKFKVGDKVKLRGSGEGPFWISSVHSGKYKLGHENGAAAKNGEEIDEDSLETA